MLKDGVFYAANKLYGITFKERHDLPVYQPDVRVFDVFDKDGSQLALFYCDYFKRDNKSGGAWMSNFVQQSKLLGTKPVVYNVANFTKPAPGQPALLSFDDVTTMFHEFGHALHGMFANTNIRRCRAPTRRATGWNSPRSSTSTGRSTRRAQALCRELQDRTSRSRRPWSTRSRSRATWNQGYALGELLAASRARHAMARVAGRTRRSQDVDEFEKQALAELAHGFRRCAAALPLELLPAHLGQWLCRWLLRLSVDGDAGRRCLCLVQAAMAGLTRENGERFRDMILSSGHTEDYGTMFRAFYGKDPDIGPMLEDRGLTMPAK